MKKTKWALVPALGTLFLCLAWGAQATEVIHAAGSGKSGPMVSAGKFVFPSAVSGSTGDPLDQVDEIVRDLDARLRQRGLGIGNMIQHTIYLKDGAIDPIKVLERFHADATKLAPGLKDRPSVGTILRVPGFLNPNTVVSVDAVAGVPAVKGQPDEFKRIRFTAGPKEIAETLTVGNTVFTAGMEAMDFQNGNLPSGLDEQIEAAMAKLQASLKRAGLTIGDMIYHNIYVTKGTNPEHVGEKFHEIARRYAPELKDRPSAGTLVVVNGEAVDGFKLEMDAIAVRAPNKAGFPRVPYEPPSVIARSVAIGDMVYVSDMGAGNGETPRSKNINDQVDVALKDIDAILRKSGMSIGDMVKCTLYIKQGAGDPEAVRKRFFEGAAKLAPQLRKNPAAENVVIVPTLYQDSMLFIATPIAARSGK